MHPIKNFQTDSSKFTEVFSTFFSNRSSLKWPPPHKFITLIFIQNFLFPQLNSFSEFFIPRLKKGGKGLRTSLTKWVPDQCPLTKGSFCKVAAWPFFILLLFPLFMFLFQPNLQLYKLCWKGLFCYIFH